MLYVGHGAVISGAGKAIMALAEKLQAPIVNTLLGKGAADETHPLHLGMLGMHGTAYANKAVADCDLIMAIGARWDDRITGKVDEFCPKAVKIHIDIDAAEFNKIVRPDVCIAGDARLVIEDLLPLVDACDTGEWLRQCNAWRKQYPLKYPKQGGLRAQHVLDRLDKLRRAPRSSPPTSASTRCGRRSSACTTKNRHWLSSGGAGTMGFGFPAAIGAQFAQPGQEGLGGRRRRRLPDDDVRAGHGRAAQAAGQGADHQQQLPRDDPPVAGAVLRQPPLRRGSRGQPRLREAGGGLRHQGLAHPPAGRRRPRAEGGAWSTTTGPA